jgi:hypothetical protein
LAATQQPAAAGLAVLLLAAVAVGWVCVKTQSSSRGQLAATQQPAAGLAVLLLAAVVVD